MYEMSSPKALVLFGTLFSVLMGSLMPFFGIYIGNMLFVL
jgi:hypothetical protein